MTLTGGVDASLLRRALRLVHCLQKERGASCAYVASRDENKDISHLNPARYDSDCALAMLEHYHTSNHLTTTSVVRRSLSTVRKMLQEQAHIQVASFHRIFVCFNTVITAVLHDFIFKQTALQRSLQSKAEGYNLDGGMQRIRSHDSFGQLKHRKHRRNNSDGGTGVGSAAPSKVRHATGRDRVRSDSTGVFELAVSDEMDVDKRMSVAGVQKRPLPRIPSDGSDYSASTLASSSSSLSPSSSEDLADPPQPQASPVQQHPRRELKTRVSFWLPTSDEEEESAIKIVRFLDILDVFVALKESTGRERAILSSIMEAGRSEAAHYMMNDLVIEVENQKRRLEQLANFKKTSLADLMQELIKLSPFLVNLQNRILTGPSAGELEASAYSTEELWDLLTVYIDKLHSLELHLVEELEYLAFTTSRREQVSSDEKIHPVVSMNFKQRAIKKVFGEFQTKSELQYHISDLSPVKSKELLLSLLDQPSSPGPSIDTGDPVAEALEAAVAAESTKALPNRLDSLLQELSFAPQSKEWEIDLYRVKFIKRIGQGSAGTTYLGEWEGSRIAVKVAAISEMGLEGWRTEVKALQRLHHPNIIRLLGSVYHPDPVTFCLVLEYCNGGDLADAIARPTPRSFFMKVTRGVAKGMAYLHSRGIIHRDIKPSNVLIDGEVATGNFQVKVTDFGVSTETNRSKERTAETGTYRWMAPEVIRHEQYDKSADVYSFAVVMWQLITRETPFSDKSTFDAAAAVAMERKRPPFPEGTPKPIQQLIESCWADRPKARPSFDQILVDLDKAQAALSPEEERWLDACLGHKVYEKLIPVQKPSKRVQLQIPVRPSDIEREGKAKNKNNRDHKWKSLFSRKFT